jgi:hypothetical protein
MPPEERLKLRKPTPHEEPRASDPVLVGSGESVTSDNMPADRRHSYMSVSTTTGLSLRSDDETIDFFKDAQETLPADSPKRPISQVLDHEPEQTSPPEPTEPEPENEPPSTSGTGSGSITYGSHLIAPGETTSPSSTSLSERIVDTPSSENLRQQAVGA